jgi:hypothetical protein
MVSFPGRVGIGRECSRLAAQRDTVFSTFSSENCAQNQGLSITAELAPVLLQSGDVRRGGLASPL